MAHLVRSDIPFHYALADAFTICDAYHCSLMGPTDPNRYYMWTGWIGNDGKGGGPVVDNAEPATIGQPILSFCKRRAYHGKSIRILGSA
jgi:phospholipase C